MDNIVITGINHSNNHSMLINILAIAVPVIAVFVYVAATSAKNARVEREKCKCGHSNDREGHCDGSHNVDIGGNI